MILKNGSNTDDVRLDRLPNFDERSRLFPLQLPSRKPRSYTWDCPVFLDQMAEGACVGFGIAHELAAAPAKVPDLSNKFARESIYWEAQKNDPWPGGAYPGASPRYEGTSVLSGVKVAQKLGYFDEYRWAFGLEDLILGVGHNGPAVLGVPWYDGMMEVNSAGFVGAVGNVVGGHCILCTAVDVRNKKFTLHNSWGRGWGRQGECFISYESMDRLLRNDGEAVFFIKRHSKIV